MSTFFSTVIDWNTGVPLQFSFLNVYLENIEGNHDQNIVSS